MGRHAQAVRRAGDRRDLRPFTLAVNLWNYLGDGTYEVNWLFGAAQPDAVFVDVCGPAGRLSGYPQTVPKTPTVLTGTGPVFAEGTTVVVTIAPVVGGRLGPGDTAVTNVEGA